VWAKVQKNLKDYSLKPPLCDLGHSNWSDSPASTVRLSSFQFGRVSVKAELLWWMIACATFMALLAGIVVSIQ